MGIDMVSFLGDVLQTRDKQLVRWIAERSEVRWFGKKELIHKIGETSPSIDLLVSGLVRGFFQDHGGKEITDCFECTPGAPLVSSFELGRPSTINLEALEETVAVSFPLQDFLPLVHNPAITDVYLRFLSRSLQRHWEAKLMVAQYPAAERYAWFTRSYPGLIDRVSHRYVASFLGITPVTLSRVRAAAGCPGKAD